MTITVHNWGGWELMVQAQQSAAFEWCTCDTGHCVPLILYRPIFIGINIRERWRMARPRLRVRSPNDYSTQEPLSRCLVFICRSFPRGCRDLVIWECDYQIYEIIAARHCSSMSLRKSSSAESSTLHSGSSSILMWGLSFCSQFHNKHCEAE